MVSIAKTSRQRNNKNGKPKAKNGNGKDLIEHEPYHMSPHYPTNIPVALRSGQAFPYTGVIKFELSQAIGETIFIAATCPGSSGTVALIGRQIGIAAPTYSVATIPTLSLSDDAGGPTSARAMKFGLSVTCNTPLLSRGARVFHLNGQARIRVDSPPSSLNLMVFQGIVSVITAMPTTVAYDNTHFGETKLFTSNVVDNVTYADFNNFEGTLTTDQIFAHMAVWPGLGAGLRDRPMSTTWLVFAPPSSVQTYAIAAHGSYYTRWGLSTVQGQSMTDIPVAPIAVVNSMHERADQMSHMAHTIMDVGQRVGAILAPLVANRAQQYVAGQLALGI